MALDNAANGELTNPYQVTNNWAQLPSERTLAAMSAIGVDSRDHVWLADRCEAKGCAESTLAPIFEFDASGKFVKSFGAGLFVAPHGMHIDAQDNIWVADFRSATGKGLQVFKFNRDGKLLLTLGQPGVAGKANDVFSAPSDVAVAPNGDIFVADGHGANSNERIVKFSKDGKFIAAWGTSGDGAGEFSTMHALVVDKQGRLLVGDRGNQRIQLFDQNGKYITEWKQFGAPSGLAIHDDTLYISGSQPGAPDVQGIWIARATDGMALGFIPGDAAATGSGASAPEDIAVDAKGNLFGPDVALHNVKKYAYKQ